MAISRKVGIRIDPLDLDTRKAIGTKIPFNKKSIFEANFSTKEQIKSNLINLLLTSQGERIHEPSYGIGLREILFEPNIETSDKIAQLKGLINQNISIHIPQITATDVKVDPIKNTNNLLVKIQYKVLVDGDTNEVSLKL
jgi:phage baseplate assembly protein W